MMTWTVDGFWGLTNLLASDLRMLSWIALRQLMVLLYMLLSSLCVGKCLED